MEDRALLGNKTGATRLGFAILLTIATALAWRSCLACALTTPPKRLTLLRIAGKDTILYHIAEAAVEHPDDSVREVVFPVASETLLRDLIKEYQSKGPAFRRQMLLKTGVAL